MRKLLFVGMAVAFASVAFGQNMLTNPGFETGDLTGWTEAHAGSFSAVQSSGFAGGSSHSGNFMFAFGALSSTDAEDFYQDVATVAGNQYDVSFWAMDLEANGTSQNLAVTFGGNTVFNGDPSSAGYTQYSGTFTATGGTTRLEVNGWESDVYILADDFSVSAHPVPEPASLAVLGLGALALIRRRRSSK